MAELPERVRKRFWSRVAVGAEDECWPMRLAANTRGYGQICWSENGKNFTAAAHRVAWELTVGPIPGELTIDHMCRNTICCNPLHLRLLTNEANGRDNGQVHRTHCPQGHPYDEANTYVSRLGHRQCRACSREKRRLYYQRSKR